MHRVPPPVQRLCASWLDARSLVCWETTRRGAPSGESLWCTLVERTWSQSPAKPEQMTWRAKYRLEHCWETGQGRHRAIESPYAKRSGGIHRIALGTEIAVAAVGRSVHVADLATGTWLRHWSTSGLITALKLDESGGRSLLATTTVAKATVVCVWDCADGSLVDMFDSYPLGRIDLCGPTLVCADRWGRGLHLWDLASRRLVSVPLAVSHIHSTTLDATGTRAIVEGDGHALAFDLRTQRGTVLCALHDHAPSCFTYDRRADRLLWHSSGACLRSCPTSDAQREMVVPMQSAHGQKLLPGPHGPSRQTYGWGCPPTMRGTDQIVYGFGRAVELIRVSTRRCLASFALDHSEHSRVQPSAAANHRFLVYASETRLYIVDFASSAPSLPTSPS